jgi:hypothetical protein
MLTFSAAARRKDEEIVENFSLVEVPDGNTMEPTKAERESSLSEPGTALIRRAMESNLRRF